MKKTNKNYINIALIENYLKTNNLSISAFCKLCKICSSTYKRIINGENVSVMSLYKMSLIMHVHFSEMFIC